MNQYLFLLIFFLISTGFAVGGIVVSRIFSPSQPSKQKLSPYECGVEPIGEAWIPIRLGYYLVALVFVIFDIEVLFLLPVLIILKNLGWVAFIEINIFVFILALGLIYAWKMKALDWESLP
ncbi:NADH-quinone oxidoreductase subunit A [Candidatus Peregrinibacteria bacterium]|nr:NADH-quinone oxidoreductase subunit A [Candidatus Peregrinibacteria bacterium]